MRKKILYSPLLLLFLLLCKQGWAQGYWQQEVNYDITVRLNDSSHTLDGFMTMEYVNHSPDSLGFIWMHLWPNAYKNDKTAFSEQKLLGGETDFYFSNYKQRGYINRLDFKVNGSSLLMEDHPQYIDVVKLELPAPLAPGERILISSSFHEKIPEIFSRGGHKEQYYALTQWYPKAAVYDNKGWHAMPYLDWGEYYNDFGQYKVSITVPSNYVVAATGTLQDDAEKAWLKSRTKAIEIPKPANQKKELFPTKKKTPANIATAKTTKTLLYVADNVTDFAWFADKRFIVKHDTIQLPSHTVDAWNFLLPEDEKNWQQSMRYTKKAIQFYSDQLGDYPYPQVSVVADASTDYDGMEYPMITMLNDRSGDERAFDILIAHEVGHNWLQAILATNERDHSWMDEGMNTYYERKYESFYYKDSTVRGNFISKKSPKDYYMYALNRSLSAHTDQPMETSADKAPFENYEGIAYGKPAQWMEKLASELGEPGMKKLMRQYFSEWQFKHPSPTHFQQVAEQNCQCQLTDHFQLLYGTGPIEAARKKQLKLTALYNFNHTDQYSYLAWAPAIGFNQYDKLELGLLLHNYNIPANRFQFVVAPMFATGSKSLVGLGRISYNWFPASGLQKVQLYAGASRFNFDDGMDLDDEKIYKSFYKISPGFYVEWKKKSAISTMRRWADFRTFFIGEQKFEQLNRPAPADSLYYDHKAGFQTTIIPQLTLGWANERVLNPWSVELGIQQVKQIVRTTVNAKYFLNYNDKNQGIAVRFFAGKIIYTQTKTDLLRSENSRYHFTMYGPNGYQDYTYSNVFGERNQSPELLGRQIMIRDGGFKYRSDYSAVQPGLKTNAIDFFDNWMAAINFEADIPNKINPLSLIRIPLKLFADVGTSASPWTANSDQQKFLYSIGLQVQLFKVLNVYYPIFQSEAFKEPNSVNDPNKPGGPNWWQKKLTFSIDLQPLKKLAQNSFVL